MEYVRKKNEKYFEILLMTYFGVKQKTRYTNVTVNFKQ